MSENQKGLSWPHKIILFFIIIATANGVLVYLAVSNPHQMADENPYEKGLRHQEVIDARHQSEKLGWKASLEFSSANPNGQRQISMRLRDADNSSVSVKQVEIEMKRPADARLDAQTILFPNEHTGEYRGQLALPNPGLWIASISTKTGDNTFVTEQKVFLP